MSFSFVFSGVDSPLPFFCFFINRGIVMDMSINSFILYVLKVVFYWIICIVIHVLLIFIQYISDPRRKHRVSIVNIFFIFPFSLSLGCGGSMTLNMIKVYAIPFLLYPGGEGFKDGTLMISNA